jgi:hypothetical protein
MKKSGLVLMLSAVAICDAAAGETMGRNQQVAQVNQTTQASSSQANASGGSCMPIGLTARGELVFPWECRAIIERERGPVSEDIATAVKEAAKDPSKDIAKNPVPNAPAASDPAAKAAADNAVTKDQAAPQNKDVDQVATIPDAASPPAQAAATVAPPDGRSRGKRLAGRGRIDSKGPPGPVQPSTARPIRSARLPPSR